MLSLILYVFALVLFILAAWPVPAKFGLGWAGMACLTAAAIFEHHPIFS